MHTPDDLRAGVAFLRRADANLAPVIDWAGECQLVPDRPATLFAALGRSIVYQQLNGRAAATIYQRLCSLCPGGERGLTPARILATPEDDLRGAGLSRNKMLSLVDLAGHVASRRIPSLARLRKLDDEAVIESLTQVRGIGRWTAEMFLMFRLGRLDVLAADDLGLRLGHAVIVRRGRETDRDKLRRYAERWRPYRSIASWYLWRAVDMQRSQQQAQQ